jgi:hypothetical protein
VSSIAEGLQETNRRLAALLEAIAPGGVEPIAATPEQLAGFLSELLQAGEWLRHRPAPGTDPPLDEELAEYRRHMERLQGLLPALQSHLLAERARLEAERAQLEAAAAWASAGKKTI